MCLSRTFTIKVIKTGENNKTVSPPAITNPLFSAFEFVFKKMFFNLENHRRKHFCAFSNEKFKTCLSDFFFIFVLILWDKIRKNKRAYHSYFSARKGK